LGVVATVGAFVSSLSLWSSGRLKATCRVRLVVVESLLLGGDESNLSATSSLSRLWRLLEDDKGDDLIGLLGSCTYRVAQLLKSSVASCIPTKRV